MSAIDREDAINACLSRLAETEEPTPPWIYSTIKKCLLDLPSLPSTEPLVHDGFYLCDKKPGACPAWERKGWTKCMSKHCNRTSRVDHALKLPDADDGWISVEDRLPEYGEAVLAYFKDDDCNVNHIIDDETGEWLYDGVIAWMPIPSYKPKEDNKC